MDFTNRIIASIVFCGLSINGIAQTLTGCVVGKDDRKPIAYASVTLKENRLYAFTDEKRLFHDKKRTERKVYSGNILSWLCRTNSSCHH